VTTTVSETVTETETVAAGLPAPVEETRAAILAAAEAGDPEAVAALAAPQFSYSFGGPVEGGPAAYWQMLEEQGERPLETLAAILRLPYTLANGIYVWPFAYDVTADQLTEHERELLGDLADDFVPGTGYLGWRAGIEPDGDWIFFIAGD
jgi:hypothetical protein